MSFRTGFLLYVLALGAQEPPVGVVNGHITDIQKGSFLVSAVSGKQFRCTYDQRTWFENSKMRVSVQSFQPEDPVEIVADRRITDSTPCYARTVRLADPAPKETSRMRISYRSATEDIIPRGEFSWSGIVSRSNPSEIVLRTRADGYKTLTLRRDTRFLEDGVRSSLERLHNNTKVFVRAGRNFEGQTEVYQVIWGTVTPDSP